MLSIFILLSSFVIFWIIGYKFKLNFLKVASLLIFALLVVESAVYGSFIRQVYKSNCFFLIGNQKVLDGLIKARLSYSVYFAQGKKSFINQLDQVLGYTIGRDKVAGKYVSNKQGFRGNREYSLFPDKDVLRMAVFGDSFVFCDGETNEDSWPHILEHSVDNLEVLNFGVPGYGLGQSYLRYLNDGLQFNPDIVFFNYVRLGSRDYLDARQIFSGNLRMADFYRTLFYLDNGILISRSAQPYDFFDREFVARNLIEESFFAKKLGILKYKMFSISNVGLFVKQYLIRKNITDADFVRLRSDLEENNQQLLRNLLQTVKKNNSTLLFFCRTDLAKLPAPLQELLRKYMSNVIYVNSYEELKDAYTSGEKRRIKPELINSSNHFNAKGNHAYAEGVLNVLKKEKWGGGDRVFAFDENNNRFVN